MKNSFVHGEDNDLAGPICLVINVQWVARFRIGRCVNFNIEPALFFVRGEWHDTVAQRAHKNFLRIQCADERDVDVTTAFEIFWNTNVLDAAGRVRVEPLLRVNAVALDSN